MNCGAVSESVHPAILVVWVVGMSFCILAPSVHRRNVQQRLTEQARHYDALLPKLPGALCAASLMCITADRHPSNDAPLTLALDSDSPAQHSVPGATAFA